MDKGWCAVVYISELVFIPTAIMRNIILQEDYQENVKEDNHYERYEQTISYPSGAEKRMV
jgi:hypothetical protein